jgi:hypothetical protein
MAPKISAASAPAATPAWPWKYSMTSERGAKAVKRHQAVSGYWHYLATFARHCLS